MKEYIKIFFGAFIIELITSPLRAVDFGLCSIVTFILFFAFQYFMSYKNKDKIKAEYVLLVSLLGCSFLQVPLRLWVVSDTLITLPDYLFHLLGILMGYWFFKSKRNLRIIIVLLSITSCTFLYFKGCDMWLHKYNHGTFTGYIQEKEMHFFQFVNERNDTISKQIFLGKYVIFDFWNLYCGICFRKFPEVEKLYETITPYKDRIELYAVNLKYAEDSESYAFETIRERGYSFPVLQTMDRDMLQTVFGVDGYPTVVILNPNGNLIFRGNIENATRFVKKEITSGL